MKKRLALLCMGCMLVMSLVACGKDDNVVDSEETQAGTEQSSTEQSSTQEQVEAMALADVKVEDYVTVTDYKGLEITYNAKETFTQEDVNDLAIYEYQAYISAEAGGIKDRAAENGDIVNIDFVGVMDGVAFDGGTAYGYDLELGSNSFIAGFEAGIVGMMPGETKDLELSFPAKYDPNPDLAGKAVTFTTKLNFIYPVIGSVEDMKDEVIAAQGFEEFATVEEFLAFCQEYFELATEDNYQTERLNAALGALNAVATIKEPPQGLVQTYLTNAYYSIESSAAQYGLDAETFCTYFMGSDYATAAHSMAVQNAKSAMLLQYIANVENLHINDTELDTLIAEFAEKNGATVEEITQYSDREYLREYFTNVKVGEFLIENGNCTEIPNE